MARLWDVNLADKAAAVDQMVKLGGVVIKPKPPTGFSAPLPPAPDHRD